jgi:hypothetical protein
VKTLIVTFLLSAASLALVGAADAATYSVTDDGVTLTESTSLSSAATTSLGLGSLTPTTGGYNQSYATSTPIALGNNGSLGTLKLLGAQIVQGSAGGQYAQPASVNSSYLSVYQGGFAIFDLTKSASDVSFTWGSVDPSNTISIVTTKGAATFTGAQLEALDNGIASGSSSVFANFTTAAPITQVILGSGQNSFEVGNVSVSPVPVPGALPLFGSALFGVGGLLAWRRRDKSQPAA